MHKITLTMSGLMAGVILSAATLAAEAPGAEAPAAAVPSATAPAAAAPAATTEAPAAAAPAQIEAASSPTGTTTAAAEAAPAAQEPVLSRDEGLALLRQNNCLVCHSIEKKVVGPAYKDVAKKYRGDAGAEARLIAKVTAGGKGVWGSVPMPSQAKAGEDNIRSLVRFVLALD